jgi:sarcosine oxidase gamma subunit
VPEVGLAPRGAFAGFAATGHRGHASPSGVTLRCLDDHAMLEMTARRGQTAALAEAVHRLYGAVLPEGPAWMAGAGIEFVGLGPGCWLVLGARAARPHCPVDPGIGEKPRTTAGGTPALPALAAALSTFATFVDQSDGRALLELSGPRVRDVLAKGVPIDLHPRAFAPGSAATSHIARIGVTLWQTDEVPTYRLATPRSSAGSFWHWLEESSAAFGAQE